MATENHFRHTWLARCIYTIGVLLVIQRHQDIQDVLDGIYSYLLTSRIFHSVYFETIWVPVISTFLLAIPFLMDRFNVGVHYKIDQKMTWVDAGLKSIIMETIEYSAPLLILDTIKAKRYSGVDPMEWEIRERNWIQYTRALPKDPPTVLQVSIQLIGSFILFDVGFFMIHFGLHKNPHLYKWIHAYHHSHDTVHSRVTNQLNILERLLHILVANYSLKAMGAHPLTRTLFVPLFIGWLMYNHSGYNFPWALDNVIPFDLVGGAKNHYDHHMHGAPSYQPFFTYIDRYICCRSLRHKQSWA